MKLNKKQIAMVKVASLKKSAVLRGVHIVDGVEYIFNQRMARGLVEKGLLKGVDFTTEQLAYTFDITQMGREALCNI